MIRLSRWLSLPLAAAIVLSGCQSLNAVNPAKPEKLTTEQVLQKADAASEKAKGYTYKVNGDQTLTVEADGQSHSVDQTVQMDMELLNHPRSIHYKGQLENNGQTLKMEAYQVGKEIYQTPDGITWAKSEGLDLDQIAGGQTQNPSKALQKVQELLSKLESDKNKPLSMKETGKSYLVKLNVTDKTNKQVQDMFLKQLTAALAPGLKQSGLTVDLDQVKLDKLVQTYTIDKKSFEQKKMVQEMELQIPVSDGTSSGTIRVTQTMTLKNTGEFKGTIEVPQHVKGTAQEVRPEDIAPQQ
ncbi:hypothetical protein GCM10011571_27600 [Marinithermofilum abyssi]|uniref:Lipoprotein n=1 Tax=Marinithermofilum abyssi TaxID=1571185 RepID=A0A8J2YAY4_9BACL|nr:DUF6612 family protein [Marinithermofilum abyssi]GGE23975.1 hypothetical protein GCM10011571_27600 [Marinithermofilum abyssi]